MVFEQISGRCARTDRTDCAHNTAHTILHARRSPCEDVINDIHGVHDEAMDNSFSRINQTVRRHRLTLG